MFPIENEIISTSIGDAHLTQIEICRIRDSISIFFHVQSGSDINRVLLLNQVFGYTLPEDVVDKLQELGVAHLMNIIPQYDSSSSGNVE